ncbi:MAG: EAL domain-containing protein [Desulfuromonadaceae bacterium]|nr:EAL domain-containing protein [Desulfuromonadaceae bacterium]
MEYAGLVENSNDLIQVVDFEGRLLYVNQMWLDTLGYSREEAASLHFFSILHPDFHCNCHERIGQLQSGQVVPRFEASFITRDGEKIVTEGSISLYQENGVPRGIQGFFRDITQRKKTEDALREREEQFRTIFESSVAGIAMLAPDGRFLQANPAFCNFLGYSEQELKQLKITDVTHPDDIEDTLLRRNIARANRSHSIVCEKRYLKKDGEVFWAQLSSTWFFDENGTPLYTVPVIQDITARKEAEERIRELAYYDVLTRLPNRSLFNDRLEQSLALARRHDRQMALMFLDLDRFKGVNDTLGHVMGDKLLQIAAQRLSDSLRENDTVARLGGDEFVVILSDYRTPDNLPHIAHKILHALAQPIDLGVRDVYVTTSIGVALYPNDGTDGVELLRNADLAMYAAKEGGGNTFRFYCSEMNARAVSRMDLESNLRRAISEEEFFLEYQPQIDLVSNRMAGLEALLRWQHPQLGVIAPNHFIPLAEETNLIIPIGEWVMRQVFEQASRWHQSHSTMMDEIRVAINVSGRQFDQPDFVDLVRRLLSETGVQPQWFEFEITENVLMKDVQRTVSTLEQLRALGIHIAIDDFGTGYSSLSCLKNLPLNRLKIDKSFIADIQDNPNDRAIVSATIAMAKRLDLEVTAEGVETEGQYGFVHKRDCDEVQGFYFCKPLPADEVLGACWNYLESSSSQS